MLALLAACAGGPDDTGKGGDTGADTAAPDWTADGTWAIVAGASVDGLGNVAVAEDVDADGAADLLAAAYLGNRVCLAKGPLAPGIHAVDDVASCLAGEDDAYAGYGAAPVGDLDGDGVPDVAVGAIGDSEAGVYAGKVYLVPGTWGEGRLADHATATLLGENAGDYAGLAVSAAGDLTGDGLPDLLVGASGYDGADGAGGGRAYLVAGPPTSGSLGEAWATVTGLGVAVDGGDTGEPMDGGGAPPPHGSFGVGDFVGDALAGPADFDGDGAMDLALGASGDAALGPSTGKALVWFGPIPEGAGSVADADVTLTGPASGAYAGSPLRSLPDLDGDGRDELLVSGDGLGAGVVWVVSPAAAGTSALEDAPTRIEGRSPGDLFGASVSRLADVDGDGAPEVAIGAPGGDTGGVESGMVHLLSGVLVPGVHTAGDDAWYGDGDGDDFGRGVDLGDLDGDGAIDVVAGAPISDVGAGYSGGVWVGPGE